MSLGGARVAADGSGDRAVGTRTGKLFGAHGRMVFAVCRAILCDPTEAEDATQATFLSAHEALLRGVDVRDPGAWLATIARNECRGRLRARAAEPLPLFVDDLASTVTPEADLERRTAIAHLKAAIGALPEKQREAVVLRDLYGLRYSEICLALGVSRPSVEALLFRARRTLRVRLRPIGGTALGVPIAVREGLAQAVPWFGEGTLAPASTAVGAGILGKLAAPVAGKLAAGAVAIGAIGMVPGEREPGMSVSSRATGSQPSPAGDGSGSPVPDSAAGPRPPTVAATAPSAEQVAAPSAQRRTRRADGSEPGGQIVRAIDRAAREAAPVAERASEPDGLPPRIVREARTTVVSDRSPPPVSPRETERAPAVIGGTSSGPDATTADALRVTTTVDSGAPAAAAEPTPAHELRPATR